MLGACQVLQLPHAQIEEGDVVGQGVDHQLGGRTRAQDLSATGLRTQAGGTVDGASEVVAITKLRLAGMQCHPDTHGLGQRPRLVRDRVLQLDRGGRGSRRPVEDGERGITLATCLDQAAAAGRDDLFDELVVPSERHGHGVGISFPGGCGAFDVGQQERHGPGDGRNMLCRRDVELRILSDDRGFQSTEFGARVDAELVGQQ
ncbi:hypothetical protein BN975_02593 [Mycolicibacterium farcinogenes]|nr:hypothetical protein BN975_02593 [Mycolicibacterium farcinogenes]